MDLQDLLVERRMVQLLEQKIFLNAMLVVNDSPALLKPLIDARSATNTKFAQYLLQRSYEKNDDRSFNAAIALDPTARIPAMPEYVLVVLNSQLLAVPLGPTEEDVLSYNHYIEQGLKR